MSFDSDASLKIEAHSTPGVIVEERDALAILRINRPEQRNSLSIATLEKLEREVARIVERRQISALIITGTGEAFASGADIRELQTLTPESAREFASRGQRLFQQIAGAELLTIAAINGFCMGGGLDLALACRVRVASHKADFAHPGARLGIITGWGGTQRLSALIGTTRALEMFTTARRLNAHEAFEIGLVTRIHTDTLACAIEIASRRL